MVAAFQYMARMCNNYHENLIHAYYIVTLEYSYQNAIIVPC